MYKINLMITAINVLLFNIFSMYYSHHVIVHIDKIIMTKKDEHNATVFVSFIIKNVVFLQVVLSSMLFISTMAILSFVKQKDKDKKYDLTKSLI